MAEIAMSITTTAGPTRETTVDTTASSGDQQGQPSKWYKPERFRNRGGLFKPGTENPMVAALLGYVASHRQDEPSREADETPEVEVKGKRAKRANEGEPGPSTSTSKRRPSTIATVSRSGGTKRKKPDADAGSLEDNATPTAKPSKAGSKALPRKSVSKIPAVPVPASKSATTTRKKAPDRALSDNDDDVSPPTPKVKERKPSAKQIKAKAVKSTPKASSSKAPPKIDVIRDPFDDSDASDYAPSAPTKKRSAKKTPAKSRPKGKTAQPASKDEEEVDEEVQEHKRRRLYPPPLSPPPDSQTEPSVKKAKANTTTSAKSKKRKQVEDDPPPNPKGADIKESSSQGRTRDEGDIPGDKPAKAPSKSAKAKPNTSAPEPDPLPQSPVVRTKKKTAARSAKEIERQDKVQSQSKAETEGQGPDESSREAAKELKKTSKKEILSPMKKKKKQMPVDEETELGEGQDGAVQPKPPTVAKSNKRAPPRRPTADPPASTVASTWESISTIRIIIQQPAASKPRARRPKQKTEGEELGFVDPGKISVKDKGKGVDERPKKSKVLHDKSNLANGKPTVKPTKKPPLSSTASSSSLSGRSTSRLPPNLQALISADTKYTFEAHEDSDADPLDLFC